MTKKVFICLVLCVALTGGVSASGQKDRGPAGVREASTVKTYPSTQALTGTATNIYKEKMDYFVNNFVSYFTKTGQLDKVKGYDTPVTVRTSLYYTAGFQEAVSDFKKLYGESFEKSRWTEAIKRAFNIDLAYKWVVPSTDYSQQLRLDMAANDLPDIFGVTDRYDLYQMAQAGTIRDLGPYKDKYGSDYDKKVWASDGGSLVNMGTFNGTFYGIPSMVSHTDFFSYLWIRQDWLDALGLQYPKTLDELTKVIGAFVNADFDKNGVKDTTGIAIENSLYYPTRAVFSGFQAYPEIWEIQGDQLAWGGINANNKKALAYLHDLFVKGYIDKEWITYNSTKQFESVLNGKCGVFIGGHWAVQGLRKMPSMDPKVEWVCPSLPTADGKPVNYPITTNQRGWLVVNSKFANPEIAYKLFTMNSYVFNNKDCDWWWYEHGTNVVAWTFFYSNVSALDNYNTYLNLMQAYKANDPSLLKAKGIPYWANLHSSLAWEWEHMFGPGPRAAMTVLDEAIKRNALFYTGFLGVPSTFMQDRWASITAEQLVTFTKIITGDIDVGTGFDDWVKRFNTMGGDQITKDVTEWHRKNGVKKVQ